MNWLYSFSTTEFIFIGLFILFYALYILRTFRLARQLNTAAWGVIPKFFLRGTYLTLLIIAILGPSFGEADSQVSTAGRDVFFLIDVSRSMDAGDVVPTRLERVKYNVQQLCDTLPTDRFGLILTSSESFVLAPLTADHDALKQFTRDIRTSSGSSSGTDLCSAIELARQKLLTDPSTRQHVKAIVLFSDGENFGPCDQAGLLRLRTFGVPLITVGVGTEAGASIRSGRDFIRDNDRQIVRSRLNRSFLQSLARDSRGQYIEADVSGRYINELASLIQSVQGRVVDQQRIAVSTNKYYYFVLVALVLMALDLIVTVRTFRL
ncbi:vWA domain-containing protein [Spirosoma utsteinense]|uniref:Ca-activated chloride channel family protein n=1 Tax=Spirosoma utsteinense TaxID=2585773 RepID=A0ABR6WBE7_9BACT|nr:VWA domain-containing protein [Spirosoma utsteinense]MBC3785314.1 Ca-activated chloride channel family protein [Spirosoma utsteinense]MBC3793882.1 Ca-activated chloride channel family protein [Spirosoma utsteinense]